jgi:hypothetical protein
MSCSLLQMRILLIALALAGCGKSRCAVFADVEARCTADQLGMELAEINDVVHDNALEACLDPQRTPALTRAITEAASVHGAVELDTLIECAQRTTECAAYRACYEHR